MMVDTTLNVEGIKTSGGIRERRITLSLTTISTLDYFKFFFLHKLKQN